MKTWSIIRANMEEVGIGSFRELGRKCGFPMATFEQQRRKNPRMFRGFELAEIARQTNMDDKAIADMVRSMAL
jgi:hypothetical protein